MFGQGSARDESHHQTQKELCNMDLGIGDKTALVLGASSGLGRAVALALAAEGVKVALAARRGDALKAVSEEIGSKGGKSASLMWDVSDLSVLDARVAEIESRLGPIDILFNNTGGPPPGRVQGLPAAQWSEMFERLVLPVIKISDRLLPGMRTRKWGRIITTTSSGVIVPIPNLAFSNVLRSSLLAWSKTLSADVAADGVTVNVVVPGRIHTDRVDFLDGQRAKTDGTTLEEARAKSVATIPMRRLGTVEEYAAVVTFLASGLAGYVTGSIIRVDGGLIASI
jgi:3-oxoacyl-[acyl-carrier protein] reductase